MEYVEPIIYVPTHKCYMNVTLICTECGHQEASSASKHLMNKIIMWNHVKKAHPRMADRIMRMYKVVPNHLYGTVTRVV